MTIIANANRLIGNLYCDRVTKKGAALTRLAKLAPAPKLTNTAGKAQQINVDVEANNEKKLLVLSSTLICQYLNISGVKTIIENFFLDIG
jgi:uncharacterized membrane-anchored protein